MQLHIKQDGMTLVEVLAAIVILSIVAVVLMNSLGFTTQAFSRSDQKVEAIRICEQELTIKLHAIQTASVMPNVGTQNETKTVNGYQVTIVETPFTTTPSYGVATGNQSVTLQGLVILKNGTINEQRLITVVVTW